MNLRLSHRLFLLAGTFALLGAPELAWAETSGGSGSGGDCGSCEQPAQTVQLLSPTDGATVPRDFTVEASATFTCSADDCGSFEDYPSGLTLYVDGDVEATCGDDCSFTDARFQVSLEPGEHRLRVEVQYDFHTETTEEITVTVEGEAGPGGSGSSGGAPAGSSSSTGGEADPDPSEQTSGCSASGSQGAPAGLAALLLLGVGALRRRRQRLCGSR